MLKSETGTAVPLNNRPNLGSRLRYLMKQIWAYRLSYFFIAPFLLSFLAFVIIPVSLAILLSFTYFNALEFPRWTGWQNYLYLLSQDLIFLKHALPNTIKFALI